LKSQRLNAPELPCSFLICDLLYFDEDLVEKILKAIGEEDLFESVIDQFGMKGTT